jgi:hypothetical protein
MPVIKLAYGLFPTGYYNAARNYRNAKSRINISINMYLIHFLSIVQGITSMIYL